MQLPISEQNMNIYNSEKYVDDFRLCRLCMKLNYSHRHGRFDGVLANLNQS